MLRLSRSPSRLKPQVQFQAQVQPESVLLASASREMSPVCAEGGDLNIPSRTKLQAQPRQSQRQVLPAAREASPVRAEDSDLNIPSRVKPQVQPWQPPRKLLPATPETRFVPPQYHQFAEYATKCALNGVPLLKDLHGVKIATDTVNEVRTRIPSRGNVKQDLDDTNNNSLFKTHVAREYAKNATLENGIKNENALNSFSHAVTKFLMPNKAKALEKTFDEEYYTNSAAYSEVTGAGNCEEMASLAVRVHSSKLQLGETVINVTPEITADHRWAVQVPAKNNTQTGDRSSLILDPWSTGPAVRQEDSRNVHKLITHADETFSKVDGSRLLKNLKAKIKKIFANQKNAIQASVEEKMATVRPNPTGMYYASEVTSPEFREKARNAAVEARKLEGPREKDKAIVEASVILVEETGPLSNESRFSTLCVNEMIPELARELGVHKGAAAAHIADVIGKLAQDPTTPQYAELSKVRRITIR